MPKYYLVTLYLPWFFFLFVLCGISLVQWNRVNKRIAELESHFKNCPVSINVNGKEVARPDCYQNCYEEKDMKTRHQAIRQVTHNLDGADLEDAPRAKND